MARSPALPRPSAALSAALARWAPAVLLVAAALALIVAEFLTMREIMAVTAVPPGGTTTGGAHHGYALAVIGVASLAMTYGAVRGGSRPAAAALVALGVVALAIVLAIDLPNSNDEGLIGRTYDLAEASPAIGFWVELGGAIALLAGGLLVLPGLVAQNSAAAAERTRARRGDRRPARPTRS